MDECGLSDMGFSGPKFTWCNRQDAQSNVRVRLDRAVCNAEFATRFADCHVENVITTSSEHYALVIDFVTSASRVEQCHIQRPFRYEVAWRRVRGLSCDCRGGLGRSSKWAESTAVHLVFYGSDGWFPPNLESGGFWISSKIDSTLGE
jgi:hypothetical protein